MHSLFWGGEEGQEQGEREREREVSRAHTRRTIIWIHLRQHLAGSPGLSWDKFELHGKQAPEARSWPSWPGADQAADTSVSASSPFGPHSGKGTHGRRDHPAARSPLLMRCRRCWVRAEELRWLWRKREERRKKKKAKQRKCGQRSDAKPQPGGSMQANMLFSRLLIGTDNYRTDLYARSHGGTARRTDA